MKKADRWSHVSTFLRSFAIQGSWNNRTMLGGGFAFAMLPVLRRIFRGRPEALQAALERHCEHFNAHPYLADLALGAICRMEADGRSAEEIRRFKLAIKGPLGSLGDALVWVGWRPLTVLMALILALAGAPPWATVLVFLVVYNLGHVALRAWGFRVGMEWGSQVGDPLRSAALARQAEKLAAAGVFALGGLLGLTLGWSWSVMSWPFFLLAATAGIWGIWLGSLLGQRGWRWTYWAAAASIGVIFLVGWLG